MDAQYVEVGINLLRQCLALQENETLLVVCDRLKKEIAEALCEAGRRIGSESILMVMAERQRDGEEPPAPIAEAMKQANVVVCATEFSLTHTKARKNAAAAGVRVATMPGITEDMLVEGAISADYEQVKERTEKVTEILTRGRQVRIEKDGKILRFSIDGASGIPSTGMYLNPGESGNLPSGEAYIAPLLGTASGEIVVDGSVAGIGKIDSPLTITVEGGRLVDAKGSVADRLLATLGDGDGRMLGEFGIGTNDKARVTGNVLEDEKVYGTIHVAFGSNITFGGTIDAGVHIDLVVHEPDVYIDDVQILSRGKLTI
ncbi:MULTISPECIES: aminopeptidase [unclassified Paenibacillus]|uniref:aminopeptidase n=1 Tax=unclassified Paenibacillus TaxID=185978 RepID=UPI001C124140|nr:MULTISPECIES: aminopeptidase [unclassified Paenibacillus]MBU5441194.1 aminopeptidase [Paenibacillus sp. MSJ-34]CAH0120480.1 hypothetical protein PAE9249_02999 [Paenibacillus sp. CECT 9249]